jgi:cytochrome c oxidase assembly protein subunit 15
VVEKFLLQHGDRQFDHRLIAWTLALLAPILWWKLSAARVPGSADGRPRAHRVSRCPDRARDRNALNVVPVPLAAAHQTGAVLLAAAPSVAHALPGLRYGPDGR